MPLALITSSRLKSILTSRLAPLLTPVINVWERRCFGYLKTNFEDARQPIFIVGAPRTGSTILYQALTNAYQVKYIDNVAAAWYRNLRFGMWLSHRKFGSSPHGNFTAEHGNTSKFGGHAPSECGSFWYRWLPTDRHFIDHDEVTERMVTELRKEVLGISAYFEMPMLFKNLNAGQRLRLIARAFPKARIIFIRRDPRFVVRSIMKARARVGCKAGQWWSIMPPNVEDLKSLPESQLCAAQVFYVEKQIEDDLSLFPQSNVFEIHYRDLSTQLIDELASKLGLYPRSVKQLPVFNMDDISKLASEEKACLESLVAVYPFKKELFI